MTGGGSAAGYGNDELALELDDIFRAANDPHLDFRRGKRVKAAGKSNFFREQMTYSRRSLPAAATTILILLGSSALFAQGTDTVGPPVLKDYQLPGERTTPPAPTPPQPQPQPKAEPATPAPQRPQAATPRRDPAPERPAPNSAPAPAAEAPARREGPATEAPAPAAEAPAPIPVLPAPTPQAAPPAATTPAAPAPQQDGSWSWLWLAIPAALGLAAFFALGRQRRPRRKGTETPRKAPAAAAPPAPPPAPPMPAARLEIDFRPERAAATPTEAILHFEFLLRNAGDAVASNIRIDARLFNASENKEAAEFLKGAIHEKSGSPHVTIAPGAEFRIPMAIALPNDQVREIHVEGRRLFVPLLASNVAWDWEGGTERRSLSWIVGREPSTPSAKMGGFRLDLGPRIYRQVAQRPMKLVA